jgi:HKD family nuclease
LEVEQVDYSTDISAIVVGGDSLSFAVAYVTKSGLDLIRAPLQMRLETGTEVRILIDLSVGNTDPTALWDLLALRGRYASLLLRAYLPQGDSVLHSKLYIQNGSHGVAFVTGSANLSGPALQTSKEHGLRVTGQATDKPIADATAFFEALWNSPQAKPIDNETARLYETYAGRKRSAEQRADRKSRAAWRRLVAQLSHAVVTGLVWPSVDAAYFLGAITARGRLFPDDKKVEINLGFSPSAYKNGQITVRGVSHKAVDVLPTIPATLSAKIKALLPAAVVNVTGFNIYIDLSGDQPAFDKLIEVFGPYLNCGEFRLPRQLATSDEAVVTEFVRGFAVACALLTDHTSMPGDRYTGLPGQMVVWLRPKQSNSALFNELYQLIQRRLGITVYRHVRQDRDPHLKILCEDFRDIGFGIDWWDELVEEGASYNFALFPQLPLTPVVP